jgi:hypothetical protein
MRYRVLVGGTIRKRKRESQEDKGRETKRGRKKKGGERKGGGKRGSES